MAYKTDGIGPSLYDWRGDEEDRAALAAEETEIRYDQEFATWNRMTYSQRLTVKNRETIDEVMGEALQELYDSPIAVSQMNWLLYHIFSDEHDSGAIRTLQALLEPYIKQAAKPHVAA